MKSVCTLLIGFAMGVLTLDTTTNGAGQLGALVILLMSVVLLLLELRAENRHGTAPAGWTITKAPGGGIIVVTPDGIGCLVKPNEATTTGRQLHRLTSAMRENAAMLEDTL